MSENPRLDPHLYGTMDDYRSPAFLEWAKTIKWDQFPGNVVYIMCISAFDAGRDATIATLESKQPPASRS